jgi:hypothetical protein
MHAAGPTKADRSDDERDRAVEARAPGHSLVRRKLVVGPAGDAAEREADAIADAVVRSFGAHDAAHFGAVGTGRIHARAEDDWREVRPTGAVGSRIRRATTVGAEGGEVDDATSRLLQASRSGGRPLSAAVRAPMEGAFGTDLGDVRVHTGAVSSELNARFGARAFTAGDDIYFRKSSPDLTTSAGTALLAHELAHVVQQRGGDVSRQEVGPVRRMTIVGMKKKKPKETVTYGPGTTPQFRKDFAALKGLVEGDDKAFMKEIHRADPQMTKDDFLLLFSRFAASETAFTDLDHFLREMKILRQQWGAQKFFHEKVGVEPYSPVSQQNKEQPIRLYGSKRREDVINLYLWAKAHNVKMSGHAKLLGKPLPTGDPTYLPKGHWADRAHTISYGSQQGEQRDLVCIELTNQASNEVRAVKNNPNRVASEGGEGYFPGEFGLKSESTFVSVAIGESTSTWDFLRPRIAVLDFLPPT